eukprot:CAMPEP_0197196672 /NCGR_PEP_ID=MMETSP1423-20130617/32477_1 /TAXON_ID=476441 /ORGANISM="Pseudo-nitzschia heimii, Strain UNC1101" /LENGTH=460 /DNA_ID=CAMNT_0042650483 /DNA_START=77 /DNA_END=1460 /DNA_ORIENTATION=+
MPSSSSSSEREDVVDAVSVGEPPKTFGASKTETIKFTIYDFEQFAESCGRFAYEESPILKAYGYDWKFLVRKKRGTHRDCEEAVSFHLKCTGNDRMSIDAICNFRLGKTREPVIEKVSFYVDYQGWDITELPLRKILLRDCLESDGSLILRCDIRVADQDRRAWFPEKLRSESVLVDLYENANSDASDVVFSVGDATYRAHRAVFFRRCRKLYEIAERESSSGNDDDDATTATTPVVPIVSTSKDAFKSLLDFVYTVKTPDLVVGGGDDEKFAVELLAAADLFDCVQLKLHVESSSGGDDEKFAVELLAAADLFDCVQLKLHVESVLVDEFLNAENAAALLILADSHSCALLKEAAIEVFLAHSDTVMKTPDWPKIAESSRLQGELIEALVSFKNRHFNVDTESKRKRKRARSMDDIDELSVTSLREKLQREDLELDGSREVLVQRLKASVKRSKTSEVK